MELQNSSGQICTCSFHLKIFLSLSLKHKFKTKLVFKRNKLLEKPANIEFLFHVGQKLLPKTMGVQISRDICKSSVTI